MHDALPLRRKYRTVIEVFEKPEGFVRPVHIPVNASDITAVYCEWCFVYEDGDGVWFRGLTYSLHVNLHLSMSAVADTYRWSARQFQRFMACDQ